MKKRFILLAATCGSLFACTKSNILPSSTVASLSFVNATVGSSPVVYKLNNLNINYSTVASGNKINYGASSLFPLVAGNVPLAFSQSTDTLHTLFTGALNLQSSGIYSLYLIGTAAQPDTVFMQEHLTHHAATDSVAGIRFINLSPGSNPVSVDIKGQANGSEVSSLSYKGRTGFKIYKADHTIPSYIFEFRDGAFGTLLATFTLSGVNNASSVSLTTTNVVRFHNMTLALIGQPAGGIVAQKVILINNY